ncbi:autotransporter outer membrane beta-barrel domain-containing protein [Limnobaculum zhutongyuii]|uniref:Autotransporter outer membrane beta-barrel domain-containing protein n=1 Tax=Limnobaculum zhutongyuii TaxID=2498113 RepID=A0A411WPP0_9GAMM|nr:autotransporter outer membrane beta-barrel domain-containing protein [Limnobaculum zhutongyuii]QBH98158.1 autotransporter outer membrane beta-barrel domain-containing protein [Limnobaculum zhutongyuii]
MKNFIRAGKKELRLSKTALCISSALFLAGFSGASSAANCSPNGGTLICTVVGGSSGTVASIMGGEYALLNQYSDVEINATGSAVAAGGVGPRGFGIYVDSSGTLTADNILITTNGSTSDGIRVNKGNYDFTILGKLTIKAQGSSGDGINVANSNGAGGYVHIAGEGAEIESKGGIGVRANITSNSRGNKIVIADGAKITTLGTGANSSAGQGYAVYAGNRDRDTETLPLIGTARVIIGDNSEISTAGKNAHAVYANKTGVIELGSTKITTTNTGAHGIAAEDGITFKCPNSICLILGTGYTDQRAYDGGQVYLTGNTEIEVSGAGSYAMYASGTDSFIGSTYSDRSSAPGIYTVTGDLFAQKTGEIDLTMIDGSNFTGATYSNEYDTSGVANTTTNGTVNLNISGASSVWNMTADSVVSNLTLDGATLKYVEPADLTDPTAFVTKNLIVAGNYTSNNGTLVLNTVLEDETSPTDKLIVKGDTAGHTDVQIVNIGGNGALTPDGIEIVTVDGISAGTFGNSRRIVAGAFDYFVRSGSTIAGAEDKNWYLISDYTPPPDPEPEPEPEPEPGPDPDPGPGPTPTPDPDPEEEKPVTPVYRPEAGSYLANMAAANTMFITRLHDRLGETQYTDALTGEKKVTSMWMRHVGGHNRFHDGSGQLKTTSNRYVMQIGGDLAQWSTDGLDRWHVGLMAGYARNSNHTTSNVMKYSSKGEVDGYSVGLYGTWYANEADKTGTYVDTWMLYNWFDNEVNGEQLKKESYKSRGITASIEGDIASNWVKVSVPVIGSSQKLR